MGKCIFEERIKQSLIHFSSIPCAQRFWHGQADDTVMRSSADTFSHWPFPLFTSLEFTPTNKVKRDGSCGILIVAHTSTITCERSFSFPLSVSLSLLTDREHTSLTGKASTEYSTARERRIAKAKLQSYLKEVFEIVDWRYKTVH